MRQAEINPEGFPWVDVDFVKAMGHPRSSAKAAIVVSQERDTFRLEVSSDFADIFDSPHHAMDARPMFLDEIGVAGTGSVFDHFQPRWPHAVLDLLPLPPFVLEQPVGGHAEVTFYVRHH